MVLASEFRAFDFGADVLPDVVYFRYSPSIQSRFSSCGRTVSLPALPVATRSLTPSGLLMPELSGLLQGSLGERLRRS